MITYTNNQKIIADEFSSLIKDEFKCPVLLEHEFQPERITKGFYFRFEFTSDEWVESNSGGETRDYLIDLIMYLDQKKYSTRREYDRFYSTVLERMRQLSVTNRAYTVEGTYYWHNWRITEISPPMWVGEIEEDVEEFDDIMVLVFNNVIQRSNYQ